MNTLHGSGKIEKAICIWMPIDQRKKEKCKWLHAYEWGETSGKKEENGQEPFHRSY